MDLAAVDRTTDDVRPGLTDVPSRMGLGLARVPFAAPGQEKGDQQPEARGHGDRGGIGVLAVVQPHRHHPQRVRHQFGRARAHVAVPCHPIHGTMQAFVQPAAQEGRVFAELHAGDADALEARRMRQRADAAGERGMTGIPRTTVSRSVSLYGLSVVNITFADGTDNLFARQEVFNRLGDLGLPDGVAPSVSPLSSPSQ